MIRIQYDDSIINNQLYCSFQSQREMGDGEYAILFICRWFGSAEILPPAGRGELLALAGVVGVYRQELLLISPGISISPDKPLSEWRDRFKRVEYCTRDLFVKDLLSNESLLLAESQERAVINEITIKNLSVSTFDKKSEPSKIESFNDISTEQYVYALVQSPSKIIAFRKAYSKDHLREIFIQSNNHNLLIYYSPFTYEGKHIIAKGPWLSIPATVRNINKSEGSISNIELPFENDIPMTVFMDTNDMAPSSQKNSGGVQVVDHEIVQTNDGDFVCPYCNREFNKRFGLTNHIKSSHKEYYDEYRSKN